jgi:hypothetical protein
LRLSKAAIGEKIARLDHGGVTYAIAFSTRRCGASSSFSTIKEATEVLAVEIRYYGAGSLESYRLPCH